VEVVFGAPAEPGEGGRPSHSGKVPGEQPLCNVKRQRLRGPATYSSNMTNRGRSALLEPRFSRSSTADLRLFNTIHFVPKVSKKSTSEPVRPAHRRAMMLDQLQQRNKKTPPPRFAHTVLLPPLGIFPERRVDRHHAVVAQKELPRRTRRERRWCLFLAPEQHQAKETVPCDGCSYAEKPKDSALLGCRIQSREAKHTPHLRYSDLLGRVSPRSSNTERCKPKDPKERRAGCEESMTS